MVNTIIYCEYNPEYLFSQIQWESCMSLDGLWNSTFYGVLFMMQQCIKNIKDLRVGSALKSPGCYPREPGFDS